MKLAIALSAAILSVASAAAFAQDASTTGRGNGEKSVGPASENGDTTTGNTTNPATMGRSSDPGWAPPTTGAPKSPGEQSPAQIGPMNKE